jgi:hypothetical protein
VSEGSAQSGSVTVEVAHLGRKRLKNVGAVVAAEVAVLYAALGQAVACQHPCICGTETKAQGFVETLVCGGGDGGGWSS